MGARLQIRSIETCDVAEIYISATGDPTTSVQNQAENLFSQIKETLRSQNAHILQERIFGTRKGLEAAGSVRSKIYSDFDDGVAPSYLVADEGAVGPISGVQVHAIASDSKPQVIQVEGKACGRIFRGAGRAYLTLSSISNKTIGESDKQAHAMMEKAESILKQFGADFLHVPRTWMWLGDILSWYDNFNRVRNQFFKERGLIGEGTRQSMPASTGIGLYLIDGSRCALDLVAVLEPREATRYLQAVGRQQCALEYGSAFSRASVAITPAGETIFVSGTASIDASGATTHIGDAAGQVSTTIENVRAVLSDVNAGDEDVVQAVIYCKTPEVEKIFSDLKPSITWPYVTVTCDICRPDLLFEIEATAVRSTSRTWRY